MHATEIRRVVQRLHNYHGPLSTEDQNTLVDAVTGPSMASWQRIRTFIVSTRALRCSTVWQFVARLDPSFAAKPRGDSETVPDTVPDTFTLMQALRLAASEQAQDTPSIA